MTPNERIGPFVTLSKQREISFQKSKGKCLGTLSDHNDDILYA